MTIDDQELARFSFFGQKNTRHWQSEKQGLNETGRLPKSPNITSLKVRDENDIFLQSGHQAVNWIICTIAGNRVFVRNDFIRGLVEDSQIVGVVDVFWQVESPLIVQNLLTDRRTGACRPAATCTYSVPALVWRQRLLVNLDFFSCLVLTKLVGTKPRIFLRGVADLLSSVRRRAARCMANLVDGFNGCVLSGSLGASRSVLSIPRDATP